MSEKMNPQPNKNDIPTVESNFKSDLDSTYYDYIKAAKLAEEAGLDEPAEELRAKAGIDIIRKDYPEVSPFEHSDRASKIKQNVESEYSSFMSIDHAETPEAVENRRGYALEVAGYPQFTETDKESMAEQAKEAFKIYVHSKEALNFLSECLDSVPYSYEEFTNKDAKYLWGVACDAAEALMNILEKENRLPDKEQFTKEYFPLFDPAWRRK